MNQYRHAVPTIPGHSYPLRQRSPVLIDPVLSDPPRQRSPALIDPVLIDPAPIDPAPIDPALIAPAPIAPAPIDLVPIDPSQPCSLRGSRPIRPAHRHPQSPIAGGRQFPSHFPLASYGCCPPVSRLFRWRARKRPPFSSFRAPACRGRRGRRWQASRGRQAPSLRAARQPRRTRPCREDHHR